MKLEVPLTEDVVNWIVESKMILASLKPKDRFFGPGYKEVVEAYDKLMNEKVYELNDARD